jgi:hypothetical protein
MRAAYCLLLLTRQRQTAKGELADRKSEIGILELCGMDPWCVDQVPEVILALWQFR